MQLVWTSFFKFYSLTQLLLLKAWFPYDCYDSCHRWQKKSSAIVAIIWKCLPQRSLRLLFISQRSLSLQSLEGCLLMIAIIAKIAELFFSAIAAITAIVAIIRKPPLSYASLLNKIRFNNYITWAPFTRQKIFGTARMKKVRVPKKLVRHG